ncbi:SMP-30/gluconolactonase/LRE family protein [Metabacillus litoralis]|uniref:SMP-30/gluconolactonase/LRE family protein n=1 Tax=Metabacillus litoralis TaxID=152268 RepID=UPI000EF62AAE|nr:SMP-30/gluconolactonase/LRE family protein [Metabacillus litoralis]
MGYIADLVVDQKATLGEGPHWNGEEQALYWVDIIGKRLHRYDPLTKENKTFTFNQYVGAAVPAQLGKMLLAMHDGIYRLDLETEDLILVANPETNQPHIRFNDGKCDSSGRFYIGTMALNIEKGKGALYRLDPSGHIHKILSSVTISNGLAWSPDEKFMYYIDTPTGEVTVFSYDKQTGSISSKKTSVVIPNEMGSPDGMTIDSDGMIWVAHWDGSRVTQWNPYTGKQLDEVVVPVKHVTSCTFGGEHLDELYITTARQGLSEEELEKYPLSGGLFKVKTKAKGMKGNGYKG